MKKRGFIFIASFLGTCLVGFFLIMLVAPWIPKVTTGYPAVDLLFFGGSIVMCCMGLFIFLLEKFDRG